MTSACGINIVCCMVVYKFARPSECYLGFRRVQPSEMHVNRRGSTDDDGSGEHGRDKRAHIKRAAKQLDVSERAHPETTWIVIARTACTVADSTSNAVASSRARRCRSPAHRSNGWCGAAHRQATESARFDQKFRAVTVPVAVAVSAGSVDDVVARASVT
jgi:hypothetical protein